MFVYDVFKEKYSPVYYVSTFIVQSLINLIRKLIVIKLTKVL